MDSAHLPDPPALPGVRAAAPVAPMARSSRPNSGTDTAGVDAATVRAELQRLLASAEFRRAHAHQRLLSHLVESSLAGDERRLKESLLGIEVFQRPAASFDPKTDSIVRVEARRLRERLQRHYAKADPALVLLRIELPTGSYCPCFVRPGLVENPQDAQAEELVQRGLYFLREGHESGYRKALQRFESARGLAPGMASACSGIARAWVQLVSTNIEPPRPGIENALAAVRQALLLQPQHADSLVLAAQLTHRFEFNWYQASHLFEQAGQVAPGSAFVCHAHAFSLMVRGEFGTADSLLQRAHRMDPLHLGLRAHQGLLALYQRDWSAACEALRAVLDMSPGNVLAMSLLAYVDLVRGRPDTALPQYRAVQDLHPGLSIGGIGIIQCQAALGQQQAARQALQELEQVWSVPTLPKPRSTTRPPAPSLQTPSSPAPLNAASNSATVASTLKRRWRYLSPYQLAMCHNSLGEPAAAQILLQRAVDERDPNALCLPVDPAFDTLRQQPPVAALVRQVLGSGSPPQSLGQASPNRSR